MDKNLYNLLAVAEDASYTLARLGRTFSSPNFTDRHGDGPLCLEQAARLMAAVKANLPHSGGEH